jgi:uncharacterized protein YggE
VSRLKEPSVPARLFAVAIVSAAVILLGLAPAALAASPTSTTATLSAQGQGSVMVTPDQGSLSLSVTRSAPTSAPALSATNASVDAIVTAVRGAGVPAAQIQTESVQTSCAQVRVGPKGHRHVIRRCSASEMLSLTAPTAILGAVIDVATHAGASSIDGPDFSFSDPSAGELAAEKAAITDAQSQANAAAAQLGDTVTGVQAVDLSPQSGIVAQSGSAASTKAAAPAAPTTLHPGQQEVDATVEVVFTIAPIVPS